MKKAYLLLFFICSFSYGQYEKEIDSILKIIKTLKIDEDKGKQYSYLLGFAIDNGLDSVAKKYIIETRALGKKGNCINCETYALDTEANLYFNSGNFIKSKEAFSELRKLNLKNKNTHMYLEATARTCESLLLLNKYAEAEKILIETIRDHQNDKVQIGMQGIYYLLASMYYEKKYYNSALNYLLKTEKSIQPNHPNGMAYRLIVLSEIAIIYMDQNNYKKANEKIKKALELSEKSKLDVFNMQILIRMGIIENHFGYPNKAVPFLNQVLSKSIEFNRPNEGNLAKITLAESYYQLKQYNKSLKYLNESSDYFEQTQDSIQIQNLKLLFAKNYLKLNEITLYTKYLKNSEELIGKNFISSAYIKLLELKIEESLNNKQFIKINELLKEKDSITNLINIEKSRISFEDTETKYQTEKKEQQIKLLSTQNELAEKQKYIYIGLLGLLIILGTSLFYGYRNKIKTAQKLNELNELKSRFFANISHEFRTPLTLIKSPVQSLQAEISNESQKNKLDLIDKNSNRMLELVDQLLELSKLDSGKLKLILKEGNIGLFLNSIVESFSFQAKENKLSFTSAIEKNSENHHFDKDVIEKIVTNLLSNAIKYTNENEGVNFQSKIENNQLQLVVSNSGSKIKKEEINKLFERFYQKKENHQGVGIGLALVKELVELYNGKIETTVENGLLIFTVLLPLEKSNSNAIVVSKETTHSLNDQNTNESELPILLLVDDNQDVRTILKDIFKENYQIIEAADGEQALKIAKKEIPDCIISDVMMPKMDGFEFTKQIKTNELTSFIPVILLTAKTSDEAHLEGLKSTADAFLTKPFNNEIVKATVTQLIAERKKLHTRYSQELVLRPVDIVINSVEEKFIEKLQLILNKELANSEFSSDDFAASIGMSRMQLHRKLKSLLGVSTSEFLRNERLKASTELLKKGKANISEIAYSVGFNDVSYFSKCFKEMYHCTPTEYMEK